MTTIGILLFGRFSVRFQGAELPGLEPAKVQELFCYLLLYPNRSHSREALAGLLWSDIPAVQSKKHLRQTLWQLQSALEGLGDKVRESLLLVEPDWVQLNTSSSITFDIGLFEYAATQTRGVAGHMFNLEQFKLAAAAIQLYRGDLLEGWYQDWCIYERERLQNAYLAMLDKLMEYCTTHQEYEAGLEYGACALRLDRARERTHRCMIRLYYLLGDRTGALRQYARCIIVLREELDVEPSAVTLQLYEMIRADSLQPTTPTGTARAGATLTGTTLTGTTETPPTMTQLSLVLEHLHQFRYSLDNIQSHLDHDIQAIHLAMTGDNFWR